MSVTLKDFGWINRRGLIVQQINQWLQEKAKGEKFGFHSNDI